jgi:hypothetical protein
MRSPQNLRSRSRTGKCAARRPTTLLDSLRGWKILWRWRNICIGIWMEACMDACVYEDVDFCFLEGMQSIGFGSSVD